MANIFLAPRSNETSHEHFESTIIEGRPYSFVKPFLTDAEKKILSGHEILRIWGTKGSLESRWSQMQEGDTVLFYARGGFYYSGNVILTKKSSDLASHLWPVDEDGNPWACLFFLGNVREIDIPIQVVQELAEYDPSWDRVMGFMKLRDSGTAALLSKFGSIESFLSQKPEVYEVIQNIIEVSKDEALEDEKEENINMVELLRDAQAFSTTAASHTVDFSPRKIRVENRMQKKRVAILEGYSCQVCGWLLEWTNKKGRTAFRIDIDHIVDKAIGGGEELSNLWALCPNCHVKKTLGVIKIDSVKQQITENGVRLTLHHDNHLGW